jgi:hypothetical protein
LSISATLSLATTSQHPLSVSSTISVVRFSHNFRSSPFRSFLHSIHFPIPSFPYSVISLFRHFPIPFIPYSFIPYSFIPYSVSSIPLSISVRFLRVPLRRPHRPLSVAPAMPFSVPSVHSAVQRVSEPEK